MPTPSGFSSATLSNTLAGTPIWLRLSASVSPPMPPPAISTVIGSPHFAAVLAQGCSRGQLRNSDRRPPIRGWTVRRCLANLPLSANRGPSMYKLYYAPGTCALASHIALEEAGAAYKAERLDFKTNQQNSPEYLAINPKGRVPALVTDHGVLTE